MKKILLLLVLVGNVAFAQKLTKDQLSEKLAEKACGCAEKQEITKDNFELTIGICLLEGINAYEKDVEKHYGKDVISNDKKMEELGYEIGKKMGMKCPTVFKFMLEDEANDVVEVDSEDLMLSGKIAEIKSEQFLTFIVKEESGKNNQFILLTIKFYKENNKQILLCNNIDMSKAGSKEAVHHLSHIKWGRVTCKHSFRSITSQYINF